ncbi:uncharacterized protein BDW70DRAFT_132994 [Aspergillus foveolatus]|uniref:uncharacterized protein n=1 Tax=Aspergillus foveolatus TaxID=210207 RepID=UPI003CCDEEAE
MPGCGYDVLNGGKRCLSSSSYHLDKYSYLIFVICFAAGFHFLTPLFHIQALEQKNPFSFVFILSG